MSVEMIPGYPMYMEYVQTVQDCGLRPIDFYIWVALRQQIGGLRESNRGLKGVALRPRR